jgi:predicted phosphodiesterase
MNREILAFNYREARSVVVCGDIHGAFEEMVFKLCVQYGMTDTLLIVAGDCGFGFEKPGYYDQVFTKISRRLAKANNWVVMIRGNHDDPAYFQKQRIHHERFRCIPDYSIVTACSHTILCIGGAISIDRTYRLAVDSRPHPPRRLVSGRMRCRIMTKRP